MSYNLLFFGLLWGFHFFCCNMLAYSSDQFMIERLSYHETKCWLLTMLFCVYRRHATFAHVRYIQVFHSQTATFPGIPLSALSVRHPFILKLAFSRHFYPDSNHINMHHCTSLPGARGETMRNKQEVDDTRPAENNRDIKIRNLPIDGALTVFSMKPKQAVSVRKWRKLFQINPKPQNIII